VPLELLILSDALFMFQRIFVLSQLIFDVLQSDVNTRKCLIDAGQIDIDFDQGFINSIEMHDHFPWIFHV